MNFEKETKYNSSKNLENFNCIVELALEYVILIVCR